MEVKDFFETLAIILEIASLIVSLINNAMIMRNHKRMDIGFSRLLNK